MSNNNSVNDKNTNSKDAMHCISELQKENGASLGS